MRNTDSAWACQRQAEWLVFSGFRVAEATTADEAMEKARRLRPHVITTDIGLSGDGDGCDLCERIKADERFQSAQRKS